MGFVHWNNRSTRNITFFQGCAIAMQGGARKVHLLLHSNDGSVVDGIAIYNYHKNLLIEITTYNGGIVASIAVLVYLAGTVRKTSANASFLIHKTTFLGQGAETAAMLRVKAEAAERTDAITDAIVAEHTEIPVDVWEGRDTRELSINASEAVQYKIAHDIADFQPPSDSQLFNI